MTSYPDPDRPLTVRADAGFSFQFDPTYDHVTVGILARALQVIAAHVDQITRMRENRVTLYRAICDDVLSHSHEGTGSKEEKALHKALEIVAQALAVAQDTPR